MKDYTGNKNSLFATLGASNHSAEERAGYDFYATDPRMAEELCKHVELVMSGNARAAPGISRRCLNATGFLDEPRTSWIEATEKVALTSCYKRSSGTEI